MTDEMPGRISIHESAHSFMAWRCGRPVGPVTVKPGKRWGGTSHYGRPVIHSRELDRVTALRPVPRWPAVLRRKIEIQALISAAGEAAEHILWLPAALAAGTGSRAGDTVAEQASDLAAANPPTPREERLLAAEQASVGGMTDAERLASWSLVLYLDGGEAASAWRAWITAEARQVITAGPAPLLRLAAVLEERGSLSGKAVRAVLESAT